MRTFLDRFRERRQEPSREVRRAIPVDPYDDKVATKPIGMFDKLKLVSAVIRIIKQRKNISMKNWKTTVFGAGGIVAIWTPVAMAALDADPATVPNIGVALSLTLPALGLLFAKDHNVTGGTK